MKGYPAARNIILVWMTGIVCLGFLVKIPVVRILFHTYRNLYFHVPMWFVLLVATIVGAVYSYSVLRTGSLVADLRAEAAMRVALLFGMMGLVTGIVWSRFTWYESSGLWWNFDPRQTMVAVELLIFGGYFVLRSSILDQRLRARLAASFNLFALVTAPFLLYIIPRQMTSLHPGAEGNPGFSGFTPLHVRLIFYGAIIGFLGVGWILYRQRVRAGLIEMELSRHE